MRPKYSSPGAEALNCSHLRCAHLLFASPHGSLLFDGEAFGFALGEALAAAVAACAGSGGSGAAINKPTLAIANASDNVDGVSLTIGNLLQGAVHSVEPVG